jgi:hypothetical protein
MLSSPLYQHCYVAAHETIPGVLSQLVSLEADTASSEDLRTKCRRALKSIIGKLTHLPALDALVHRNLPEAVMKMVLEQVGQGVGTHMPTAAAVSGGARSSYPSTLNEHVWVWHGTCNCQRMMLE